MGRLVDPTDPRAPERIRAQYEIERELADRLRDASADERRELYAAVYEELFRRVPDHPQLVRKTSAQDTATSVALQLRFLTCFLGPGITFLEIGAGDCALSIEVARTARKVYALDVSETVTAQESMPDNVTTVLSDGISIPVPSGSVAVAYSNQLMEHLHPDDAFDQLRNIAKALAPGGRYVCVTPNRLTGPHDVSRHFDPEATGFHIKEYTTRELTRVFRAAGFAKVTPYMHVRGHTAALPTALTSAVESTLRAMPVRARARIARALPWRWLLGIRVVGTVPEARGGAVAR